MRSHERAAQIWPLLCFAAKNRQILTYSIVGDLIGVPRFALAQLLEPIQSYCLLNKLPALTVLVVNKSGEPGLGFIAAKDLPLEQHKVFEHPWLEIHTPSPEDLEQAVLRLPSCGIPEALDESKNT
ncbi:hypothetical protein [Vibrio parahaemolyticus]|uniref:hypothetical protein n=1 Tax=Vibrio parahaemolyticus TaxID=670 RepID=UPI00193E75C1|nr:hypothetical protein [Vibrio parahaemolyticus]MBE3681123.1 hypothetical protein [Vibrio parahaemolyticus]MBM5064215.1 hypothetical protein [Vibrio parahaemolyticus]MDS1997873.1 hypothetical protein [Vibrio parahaemolyticus]